MFQAAYNHLTPASIAAFCQSTWNITSLQQFHKGYNAIFRGEKDGVGYFIRLTHESIRGKDEIIPTIDFLKHLATDDVPVCKPVMSQDGEFIVPYEQDGYQFYAVAVTEVPGEEIQPTHTDFEAWGRSLGQLHASSKRYTQSTTHTFPTIQQFWENVAPQVPKASPAMQAAYTKISAWMQDLPQIDYGLTHGDYRPGNVLWDGETAHTVDFDEPVLGWYVIDIARALGEWVDRPYEERIAIRDAFIKGYRSVTSLDERWVKDFSLALQLRGLLMRLWSIEEGDLDIDTRETNDFGRQVIEWATNPVKW